MREVAAAVGLFEAEGGVRAVLAALARLEPVSTRRLSRAVALPVPIVASVCGELRKRGVVADERPAQLTAAGRALFAAGELRLERRSRCPSCAGRAVVIPPGLTRVVRTIARDAAHAPPPRLELDQCHCTVETKLRRVLAIHEAGALTGRRILFLGDDDLTSLALRRLVDEIGSESTIEHVGVVDIDPAIVAFVERGLTGAGFSVSCLQHDLRSSLPRGWSGAFDTVVTDPPYTVEGARVFLSRAAEAISPRVATSSSRSARCDRERPAGFSRQSFEWASSSRASTVISTSTSAPESWVGRAICTTSAPAESIVPS